MTIWCNAKFGAVATSRLRRELEGHRLILSPAACASVLEAGGSDPALAEADIAWGQPDPRDCLAHPGLRWVELTSAGYARYEADGFLETFAARGSVITNASAVFADPCAQHLLAMMLALGRQLLPAYRSQLGDHAWEYETRRANASLLGGQTVVFLGYGAIARRLAGLLAPFGMRLYALRRRIHSERGVHVVPEGELTRLLPLADHVVNTLPGTEAARGYVNARRLACFKPGARFYNVGRGTTVDQRALAEALRDGRLGAAYLDVTDPEPLPPDHELWTTPNCYLTPHAAGGRSDQDEALVDHFLANLRAFESGAAMSDRVQCPSGLQRSS